MAPARDRHVPQIVLGSALALGLLCGPALAEDFIVHIVSDYESMRFAFEPHSIIVQPGDSVTWINDADEEHNLISYPGGYPEGAAAFQSPYLKHKGDSFTQEFTQAGSYQYHCMPHLMMGMTGEVVVGQASAASEFHVPNRSEILAYHQKLLQWFDDDENLMHMRISDKTQH
jgi:pseudoazurin